MTSVLLVYPFFRRSLDRSRFRFPPLGVAYVAAALRDAGFECSKILYNDSFAFPLSGGYIGRQLVPRRPSLYGPILRIDRCLEAVQLPG